MPRLEWSQLRAKLGPRLKENETLGPYTTFRIGGPADWFVRAESRGELVEFWNAARAEGTPVFILGNGSNILIADSGIQGLVIENHADAFETHEMNDNLALTAESGASLPGLANRLARQGWSGLEWGIGVPSTIGAAVVGNAGAHGGSIGDILTRAELLGSDSSIEWVNNADLQFGYRTSRLKREGGTEIVLRAEFTMNRDEPAECIARMNRFTEHRRRTQPTEASVGSMFKNPPGDYAGRMIEAAGLKGKRVRQVEVSPIHANFFVNNGGGKARDVIELIELVRERVKERFGVELELEIQLVGRWDKKVLID